MSDSNVSDSAVDHLSRDLPHDLKIEVVVIPVSDVERAKRFYGGLGWQLDADLSSGSTWRVVQMTPPGSACSVHFGTGLTGAAPGSNQNTYLVVDDIAAVREELLAAGAAVSAIYHVDPATRLASAGPDPERRSYLSYASFPDPDGNTWLLQEIRQRLPGRGLGLDRPALDGLLREAETQHGLHGDAAPTHHWSEWYAGYVLARLRGQAIDAAVTDAASRLRASL